MNIVPKKNAVVLLLLVVTAVILRFYSFFPAVMDHDESTYLIIGRDIALGDQLYVDVTDTKPVGIFLIYAFFYKIFGYSIFLTRVLVALMVGLTSYLLFRSSLLLFKERIVAFAAAIIYLFYTATWTKLGVAPNTELFFNFTTIIGFLLLLKNKNWSYILSGFVFGLGFMIKYLVIFDCVFLFSFFLFKEFKSVNYKLKNVAIIKFVFAGIAFSIPFLATHLYFYLIGNFEAFKYITYELPSKYGQTRDLLQYITLVFDFLGRFLPVSIIFFYILFFKSGVLDKEKKTMFLLWITGILIAMYLPGKGFPHYTIQLMLPFSLIAAFIFHHQVKKGKFLQWITGRRYGFYVLGVIFVIIQAFGISGKMSDKDKPREIARYLEKKMKNNEWVYTTNYQHILYYLLETESPTKYVHPSLLTNPAHANAFGIDGKKEIQKIIDNQPDWLVMYDHNSYVKRIIQEKYVLDTLFFDGLVEVYKIDD